MRRVGGGWTLCGHAGGMPVLGGSKHWYGDYGEPLVKYSDSTQEATWCGKVPKIAEVMFTVVKSQSTQTKPTGYTERDFHPGFDGQEHTSLVVNWEGATASKLPTGKIHDDIWAVEVGNKQTNQHIVLSPARPLATNKPTHCIITSTALFLSLKYFLLIACCV